MASLGIVIGSTRPGRVGAQIGAWLADLASADAELIDLAVQGLPFLDEPEHASTGRYAQQHTRRWSELIASHDAFVLVTPEYNSSFPASLKNALDYLYHEWRGKPVGIVGYGGVSSGGRAVHALLPVIVHLQMIPVDTLLIRFRQYLVDGRFQPDEALDADADELLTAVTTAARSLPVAS
ncbi:MAG: NAD(P)H-dependent oxidoreductase [Catenulispora sp.]|nr:NAD(P)H-dependent oxidoreductase [Catenulispora sp.]